MEHEAIGSCLMVFFTSEISSSWKTNGVSYDIKSFFTLSNILKHIKRYSTQVHGLNFEFNMKPIKEGL